MTAATANPAEDPESRIWKAIEEAVQRLEDSWNSGVPFDLKGIALPQDAALRLKTLAELIKVDQEYRWKHGQPKLVEAYLNEWPELAEKPTVRLELIKAECVNRGDFDIVPAYEELVSRFGEDTARQVDLTKIETQVATDQQARQTIQKLPPGIGSRFADRYVIRGVLGSGGMGTVLRAYDENLKRDVALKFPRPDIPPAAAERLRLEAQALAQIRHQNVCPVHDAGKIDDRLYIVMDVVQGKSLQQKITSGRLSTQESVGLTAKLCRALAHIHHAGLIHRDVKPANVMIETDGEPKLMDFGLAQQTAAENDSNPIPISEVDHKTRFRTSETGICGGTLAFMSPEQVNGEPLDARTDIYSTGVLLYRLLTGKLPITGSAMEMVGKISTGEFPASETVEPGIPPALHRICRKAMSKKRDDRFATADEMADALEQFADTYVDKPGPIQRWRWWAVAACILGMTALGILFTGKGQVDIQVAGMQDDVVIEIDGKEVPSTDLPSVKVSVGSHEIVVRRKGSSPLAKPIKIRWRGDRQRIEFWLPSGEPPKRVEPPSIFITTPGRTSVISPSEDEERIYAAYGISDDVERVFSFSLVAPHESEPVGITRIPELVGDHPEHYKGLLTHSNYLYVVDCYAPYIVRVDLRDDSQDTLNLFRGERPEPEHLFASTIELSPNGERLVVLGGLDSNPKYGRNDRVYVIDIRNDRFELLDVLELNDEPANHGIAFTADGRHIFLTTRALRSATPMLLKIQISPNCEIVESVEIPGGDIWGTAYSPSLDRVLVADTRVTKIRVFNGESLAPQPQFDVNLDQLSVQYLSLHEPTRTLAATVPNGGPILLINLSTGKIIERLHPQSPPQRPLFSKNGNKLFVGYGGDPGGIAIYDLTGLTSTVVFSSNHEGDFELYRMNENGTDVWRLTRNAATDVAPRFSPFGRHLAFISDRPLAVSPERKDPHIWIYDCTTGQQRPLVRTDPIGAPTAEGVCLDWSPSGETIAYIEHTGNSIHTVNVTTGFTEPLLTIKDVTTLDEEFANFDAFRGLSWEARTNSILLSCRRNADADKHDLFQLDVATRRVKPLKPRSIEHTAHMSPRPSPLGDQLAVIRQSEGAEVSTRHVAILSRHDLVTIGMANAGNGTAATPSYSPDGEFIYFTAMIGFHRQVFRVPAKGGDVEAITFSKGDSIHPDTVAGRFVPVVDSQADVEIQIGETGNK